MKVIHVFYRAGDWGKTDYHIIRTWTPRLSQPNNQSHDARIQSNDSLPTLTHTRQKDNVAEDLQVSNNFI